MRLGALVPVCLIVTSLNAAAATTNTTTATAPAPTFTVPPGPALSFTFRKTPRPHGIITDLDSRVLAALLASMMASDFELQIRAGEPGLCETRTCSVPVTIKLPDTAPPMKIAIAVANAKGEISEVRHAECVTQQCTMRLVLERGRNTLAVGAGDQLTHTAGVSMITVDASPNVAISSKAKTEWF